MRNQPMILFGPISLPALDETVNSIIRRALHGRPISTTLKLLFNLPPGYRGFRCLRLAAQ